MHNKANVPSAFMQRYYDDDERYIIVVVSISFCSK